MDSSEQGADWFFSFWNRRRRSHMFYPSFLLRSSPLKSLFFKGKRQRQWYPMLPFRGRGDSERPTYFPYILICAFCLKHFHYISIHTDAPDYLWADIFLFSNVHSQIPWIKDDKQTSGDKSCFTDESCCNTTQMALYGSKRRIDISGNVFLASEESNGSKNACEQWFLFEMTPTNDLEGAGGNIHTNIIIDSRTTSISLL